MIGLPTRPRMTDFVSAAMPRSPLATPSCRSARSISNAVAAIISGICTAMISAIGSEPAAP